MFFYIKRFYLLWVMVFNNLLILDKSYHLLHLTNTEGEKK